MTAETGLKAAFSKAIEKRSAEIVEEAEALLLEITNDIESGELVPWVNELEQWFVNIEEFLPTTPNERNSIIAVMRRKDFDVVDFAADDKICMRFSDQIIPSDHENPKNLYYYCASCGVYGESHPGIVAKHVGDNERDGWGGSVRCDKPVVKGISLDDSDVAKIDAAQGDVNFLELIGAKKE